ncbi:hypothetical protein BD414DRAFT_530638 [Trametes punicea]|nr:hypothetical protein BD414DRAFT_530638 [Trametes punicea]
MTPGQKTQGISGKRRPVPPEAKLLRNALYQDMNRLPTLREKLHALSEIKKLPGTGRYTRKQHLSWCSRKEKKLTARAVEIGHGVSTGAGPATEPPHGATTIGEFLRAQLGAVPDPPFSVVLRWAREVGAPIETVAAILRNIVDGAGTGRSGVDARGGMWAPVFPGPVPGRAVGGGGGGGFGAYQVGGLDELAGPGEDVVAASGAGQDDGQYGDGDGDGDGDEDDFADSDAATYVQGGAWQVEPEDFRFAEDDDDRLECHASYNAIGVGADQLWAAAGAGGPGFPYHTGCGFFTTAG